MTPPGYLTVQQTAEAMKTTVNAIYQLIKVKRLPVLYVGRTPLIARAEVRAFRKLKTGPKPKISP